MVIKLWVIFPVLPLAFWSREVLESIGNKLGSFVKLELNWDSKKNQRWAWILVKRDPDQVRRMVARFDCKGIIIELLIKELFFLSQIVVY